MRHARARPHETPRPPPTVGVLPASALPNGDIPASSATVAQGVPGRNRRSPLDVPWNFTAGNRAQSLTVRLENAVMPRSAGQGRQFGFFFAGATAHDADDHVIYN